MLRAVLLPSRLPERDAELVAATIRVLALPAGADVGTGVLDVTGKADDVGVPLVGCGLVLELRLVNLRDDLCCLSGDLAASAARTAASRAWPAASSVFC